MTVRDRLERIVQALPTDGSVTLTRSALLEWLAEAPAPPATIRDLTVDEVAEEVQRSRSTVRGWLADGQLRGYKLNGRSWRVPRAALRAFLDAQGADPVREDGAPDEDVDIGEWRKLRGLS